MAQSRSGSQMRDAEGVGVLPQSSTFVGRATELGVLVRLLDSRAEEGAGAVLVTGEAGMGKSRLVGELCRRAEESGWLVATGRTSVEGAALPYGTVVGLLRDLARRLAPAGGAELLEPVQRLLLGAEAEPAAPAPLARLVLFEAVLAVVDGLSATRPIVLVLEDLHWADPGSVELLDHLVRNVGHQAVLIVATFRPDAFEPQPSVRRVLAELRRLPSITTVDLEGMSRDEVGTLLSEMTGRSQSWAVVDAVYRRSEGNPLFAEELAAVRDRNSLPPALRDLLAARIEQLPPDARRAVAAAAVLGGTVDHRVLADVAELDGSGLDSGVADAVRHGVLVADGPAGVLRFRHSLLREVAHDELLPGERARLHHRAADALVAHATLQSAGPGHEAAELAEHHFEAGDWAAACEASIAAAHASTALYSMHAAHAHLQRAIAAHGLAGGACRHPDVDDAELYRRAAETAYLVSEMEMALAFADAALAALDPAAAPARTAACASLLARSAWAAGRPETAFSIVASAEALLHDEPDGAAMAEVISAHARLLLMTGRSTECRDRCEAGLVLARGSGARVVEGHLLATLGPCLIECGEEAKALEAVHAAVAVAEETGERDLLLRAYMNLTHVQYLAGQLEDAARVALDASAESSPLATMRLASAGYNSVEVLILLGRWDEAAGLLSMMAAMATAACTSDSTTAARLAMRRGDLEVAADELNRRADAGVQHTAQRETLLAELALEQERTDEAVSAVDRALVALAGADMSDEFLRAHALGLRALADQTSQPVRPGRRRTVDSAKASRQAESMLAEVDAHIAHAMALAGRASRWQVALGSLCRAEAARVTENDPEAWSTAAAALNVLGDRYHVAYCGFREAEARLAHRADRRLATEALTEAWQDARNLGAAGLARRCERLAERARITLDDPSGPDASPQQRAAADLGLTAREAEVLDLLAQNCTDGQIAEELFISKKTASVHVSNILRKLDLRDRWHAGEVGRAAGLGGAEPSPDR
jgi:ATP/maltotriose-dependent transcriptional regulator MalT